MYGFITIEGLSTFTDFVSALRAAESVINCGVATDVAIFKLETCEIALVVVPSY